MTWVGVVPAAMRGVTGYANLAAAVAANPGLQGLSGSPYDAPYLDANDLQIDVAAQLIRDYTAFNSVGRPDSGKTAARRSYLSSLSAQAVAPRGTGGAPGDLQDNFAWVAAIRAAITAFPD